MLNSVRSTPAAFTLVELVIVLVIMLGLSLSAIPGVMSAARRAAINGGAMKLQAVISEAQRLARRTTPLAQVLTAASHYGVAIVTDEGAPYATILYGTTTSAELLADDGKPVGRAILPASLAPSWDGASPRLAWFFQYGTGKPIQSPALQSPVDIGTPAVAAQSLQRTGSSWSDYKLFNPARPAIAASPVTTSLQLRHRSGQAALAMAVYSNGLLATTEVP